MFGTISAALQTFVLENLVPSSADAISGFTQQFSANARKLTAVGIGFLAVTSILLMMTIERAFNQIWRVRRARPVLQRIFVYWTLITIGPILVGASLSLTSWFVSQSLGLSFVKSIPGLAWLTLHSVPVVLTSLALGLLYLTMPNRRVVLKDAVTGGILAGAAFEVMKRGFALYIEHFPTYRMVYGAFAALPVFLLWIYLSWVVVIFGALVVSVLPEWRERAGQRSPRPGGDFFDALQLLKILWRAHHEGGVVTMPHLLGTVQVSADRLEAMLDTMVSAAWVSRAAPAGWVMNRDAAAIQVTDVYRLFVLDTSARVPSRDADAELERMLQEMSARAAEHMAISIEQLFSVSDHNAGERTGATDGTG